jgi:hypothetical protein
MYKICHCPILNKKITYILPCMYFKNVEYDPIVMREFSTMPLFYHLENIHSLKKNHT